MGAAWRPSLRTEIWGLRERVCRIRSVSKLLSQHTERGFPSQAKPSLRAPLRT